MELIFYCAKLVSVWETPGRHHTVPGSHSLLNPPHYSKVTCRGTTAGSGSNLPHQEHIPHLAKDNYICKSLSRCHWHYQLASRQSVLSLPMLSPARNFFVFHLILPADCILPRRKNETHEEQSLAVLRESLSPPNPLVKGEKLQNLTAPFSSFSFKGIVFGTEQ